MRAASEGWLKAGQQLTATGRAMASFLVIMDRARLLSKSTETAADTFALRILFLKAQLEDAAAALGRGLLPVLIPVVEMMRDAAEAVSSLGSEKIKLILRIGAVAAAIGPLLKLIGGLLIAIQAVTRAMVVFRNVGIGAALIQLLSPAGLILAGLAALAAALYLIYRNANKAGEAFDRMRNKFREDISEDTDAELFQRAQITEDRIARVQLMIDRLNAMSKPRGMGTGAGLGGLPKAEQELLDNANRTIKALRAQLELINERRRALEKDRAAQAAWDKKVASFAGQPTSVEPLGADPFRQLKEDVGATIRRMQIIAESVGRTSKLMRDPLEDALEMYDEILFKIEQYGGFAKAPNDLLELQVRLLKEINEQLDETALHRAFPELDKGLRAAAERARLAAVQLEIAKRRGIGVAEATRAHEVAQQGVGAVQQQILDRMTQMGIRAEEQVIIWNAVKQILQEMGVVVDDTTEKITQWTQLLRSIAVAARGVLNLAEAFGEVDKRLRDVLEGIAGTVEGLEQFRRARKDIDQRKKEGKGASLENVLAMAGGIVGIIGGALRTIRGLFVDEEAKARERERANILRENNQKLADLAASMRGMTGAIDNLLGVRAAIGNQLLPNTFLIGLLGNRGIDTLLRPLGLTFRDLDRIAEEVGIQIRDSAGKIVPAALKQLYDALLLAAEAATRFTQNMEGQRRRLELRADIFDVEDTPIARIQRELQLLERFAPELAARFADFDVTTAAGRAQLELALRALFEAIEAGTIPLEQFGELQNLDELLDVIMGVEGALDELREQANSLTDALKNVPTGFKVAFARFEATAATAAAIASGGGFAGGGRPVDVVGPPGLPGRGPPIVIEHVHIDARDRTMKEAFDEVTQQARDESRRKTGTTAYPFRNIA